MLLTILSGLFGGLLRLAPEFLKFLSAKDDRVHELAMMDKQVALVQQTGQMKLNEVSMQGSIDTQTAQFQAYSNAYISQTQMAQNGGAAASFISSMVRPAITFIVFGMWVTWKISIMIYAWRATGDAMGALVNNWTQDDSSIMTMVVAFWFVGRAIEKKG